MTARNVEALTGAANNGRARNGGGDGWPPGWAPVDLGPILDGSLDPPTTSVLARGDGVCLFYAEHVNGLHG